MSPPPEAKFFQQLADGFEVMIWMSGLDMGCFYFNRAWLDFRGRTLEQEWGNGWAEGVHPEDLDRCVNHYATCFERRSAFAMTYRLRRHDGEYHWILDRGAPHYQADGTFLGFYGGCGDLAERGPLERYKDLRSTLNEMRAFAQQVALEKATALNSLKVRSELPLQVFAQKITEAHAQELIRMQHVAAQMERLAADMLEYGQTPPGACLPS